MPRTDPYGAFNFLVEIDGLTVAGFSECSGLSSETAVIEYREGSDPSHVRKLIGLRKFTNIVLKRGLTANRDLWQWHQSTARGTPDRRSGAIVLLDDERNAVARFRFVEGWIAKWVGPSLKASGNEIAIETIEIVHEGLELE